MPRRSERPTLYPSFDVAQYAKDSDDRLTRFLRPALDESFDVPIEVDEDAFSEGYVRRSEPPSQVRLSSRPTLDLIVRAGTVANADIAETEPSEPAEDPSPAATARGDTDAFASPSATVIAAASAITAHPSAAVLAATSAITASPSAAVLTATSPIAATTTARAIAASPKGAADLVAAICADPAANEAWAHSLVGVPYVAVEPRRLMELPLGHRAGFLLSRIDGALDVETLVEVSAMPREETLSLIRSLFESGVVDFR